MLPIAQMYHVTVDDQIPYFVYGNKQDGSSYRGPAWSGRRSGENCDCQRNATGFGFDLPGAIESWRPRPDRGTSLHWRAMRIHGAATASTRHSGRTRYPSVQLGCAKEAI